MIAEKTVTSNWNRVGSEW